MVIGVGIIVQGYLTMPRPQSSQDPFELSGSENVTEYCSFCCICFLEITYHKLKLKNVKEMARD
jgi:hypothetical protein